LNATKNTPIQALWTFLCSLKLTIFNLIMLAVTSIIGTVIQQNRPPQEYVQVYGEKLYRLFESLQFVDMYHSWWFLSLLILFSLNLTACSIKRLPRVWKTVREPFCVPGSDHFGALPNAVEFASGQSVAETGNRLAALLSRHFGRPEVIEEDGRVHLFAQKMPWARFGVYVTHLSILLIFAGAIIGNFWGFKAYVNIVEGTETDQVWPRGSKTPLDLGFTVRCDDFAVSYYDGTNRPREFMSILDIVDNGEEVIRDRKIVVNDPLTYNGITLYQSSYGPAGGATFKMRVRPKGGEAFEVSAQEGEHVPLANGGSFAVTGYAPDYKGLGPAVQMHVNTPDGRHGNPFIVFSNHPEFDARRGGEFSFALLDYDQLQYTGLEVKKDPGVWVVWTGCILMVLGTIVAFMLSHRRIWISVEPAPNSCLVRLGGTAHRNQPAFELFFDEFKENLAKELKG